MFMNEDSELTVGPPGGLSRIDPFIWMGPPTPQINSYL